MLTWCTSRRIEQLRTNCEEASSDIASRLTYERSPAKTEMIIYNFIYYLYKILLLRYSNESQPLLWIFKTIVCGPTEQKDSYTWLLRGLNVYTLYIQMKKIYVV